jgi:hypothetical protein
MFDFSIRDFADLIPNNDTFQTGVKDALETSMLMCEEELPDPSSGYDAAASPSPAQRIRSGLISTRKLHLFDRKHTNPFMYSENNTNYANIVNIHGKRHSYDFFTGTWPSHPPPPPRKRAAKTAPSRPESHVSLSHVYKAVGSKKSTASKLPPAVVPNKDSSQSTQAKSVQVADVGTNTDPPEAFEAFETTDFSDSDVMLVAPMVQLPDSSAASMDAPPTPEHMNLDTNKDSPLDKRTSRPRSLPARFRDTADSVDVVDTQHSSVAKTPTRPRSGAVQKRSRGRPRKLSSTLSSQMLSSVAASGICCSCCSKILTPEDMENIPVDTLRLALLQQQA